METLVAAHLMKPQLLFGRQVSVWQSAHKMLTAESALLAVIRCKLLDEPVIQSVSAQTLQFLAMTNASL